MPIKVMIRKWKGSQLLRNTSWMFLGQMLRLPIQSVYFILIAKSLGANGYGAFIGVTSLVAVFAPFASLGSGNILIKNVSRDPSSFPSQWGKALMLTCLSGAVLLIVTALLSKWLLPASIPMVLTLSVALADLIFSRLLDITSQAYQALGRLGRTSLLTVLPNVARLLLIAGLLMSTPHPAPLLWGYFYLLGVAISSVIGIVLVNKELGKPVLDRSVLFAETKEGLYFSVSLSAQTIYNDIDKTMLTRLATLEAAGVYGAAYRLIDVAFTPVRSLLSASYSRFFQSGVNGIRGTLEFALKPMSYAVGYSLVISILCFLFAPILPHVLGPEYKETILALRWLALLPVLKSIHYFAADSLTGAGFQGTRTVCQFVTALLNVALILWLIPTYSWVGAAWASLASDSFLALSLWALVLWRRNTEDAYATRNSLLQQ